MAAAAAADLTGTKRAMAYALCKHLNVDPMGIIFMIHIFYFLYEVEQRFIISRIQWLRRFGVAVPGPGFGSR
ncbi:unnamed protein product [Urochloa humidicola]